MKAKYTKGPWLQCGDIIGTPAQSICSLHGRRDDPETKANANLIAAAPEMLEALTDLVGGGGKEGDLFSTEAMDKAHAAIAKALIS